MKMYTIEIDEKIWNYLKTHAEPFIDTPNSVLNKIIFGSSQNTTQSFSLVPSFMNNVPKALSQILEVIFEVRKYGRSRTDATNKIAQKRGTAPQTIIDKYCRQLGKKAYEIDRLLQEPDLNQFRLILERKFIHHKDVIDSFFRSLDLETDEAEEKEHDFHTEKTEIGIAKPVEARADGIFTRDIANNMYTISSPDGFRKSFQLPNTEDKEAIRKLTHEVEMFVRERGGTEGQIKSARKKLTEYGYHITK